MPHHESQSVTLLTGFPSFLPRRLARHLLEQEPGARLYAIVRANFAREAHEVLASWPCTLRERVVILQGDAASMDLGLSASELRMLAREVDVIHHAAHVTYPGVDRSTAELVNVGAAHEIVEVARLCTRLQCLAFHSTVEVAGDRGGVVREDELEAGQRFGSDVAETRAIAEKTVRAARRNLPIVILRASTIVGDSVSGEIDRFDGPYALILHIVSSPREAVLPLPGRADTALNLVPVDYVVRASHAIARDRRAIGRTFHLVDPHPHTAREVFEAVARASSRPKPRGYLPPEVVNALRNSPAIDRLARAPQALVERFSLAPRYDTTNVDELLAGTGIVCPPFEDYVATLVRYVQTRMRERRVGPSPDAAGASPDERSASHVDAP